MPRLTLTLGMLVLGQATQIAAQRTIDSAAIGRFADAFFPAAMAKRHIPGLTFGFAYRDGSTVLRGYGYENVGTKTGVDPLRTRFRLASVSKTITATAVMQLVETGTLDLHRNVNAYVRGFQLSSDRGTITLHHLLTHTAGFDEQLTGIAARTRDSLRPLSEFLASTQPPTFAPPGEVISYSNYGYGLAGLLIEDVSGQPFVDYVREKVFAPLGMSESGALTGALPPRLAVAYELSGERLLPLSPEYMHVLPSGAFYSTAHDMARFVAAHLCDGELGGVRIMNSETAARMHSTNFRQHPALPGFAYGFWEDTRPGARAILHDGGGRGYRALVYLLPELGAGFFVAYNLADKDQDGELLEALVRQFRREFVSPTTEFGARPASVPAMAGDYWTVRRARHTPEKMIAWPNRIHVTSGDVDGGGDRLVAFDTVKRRVFVVGPAGFPAVYEPTPLLALPASQIVWVMTMVAGFLLTIRRSATADAFIPLVRFAALIAFAFLIAFPLAFVGRVHAGFPAFAFGMPPLAGALRVAPIGVSILTAVAAVDAWRNRDCHARAESARRVVMLLGLTAFLAFVAYWRVV